MLHIPKIGDYLKISTDDKVREFLAMNFSESFKSTKEKFNCQLNEEQPLRKVAKLLYIFLKTSDEVETYVQ